MRIVTSVNRGWSYTEAFLEEYAAADAPLEGWSRVDLPHSNKELPYNGFDEKSYQFVSCYARDVEVPPLAGGRRAFLDFQGVANACRVWVDGREAGSHLGGYTPFSVELTPFAREEGGRLRVTVRVDSTERADVPPFGHVIDYLCYGGIYREVTLRVQEAAFISGCFARPLDALLPSKRLELDADVDLGGLAPLGADGGGLALECALKDGDRAIGSARAPVSDSGAASLELSSLEGVVPWDVDDPRLYTLEIALVRGSARIDAIALRIGFRSAVFKPDGFYLNGRKLPLAGLNRHQSFPYVGYAMPARAQRRDAEILKRELGVNVVRTSHYPQSTHFLDACDELGLLVFEELPGWQHIGGPEWKDTACLSLEEMIRRDRNRPSVVLWGVRINESGDDHDFYARTNEAARRLDPTRQTGGVRFLEKSELLEDVYTFNDFSHSGGALVLRKPRSVTRLRRDVPYLVTEHNGHMFPTKRFDNEERLVEHSLRHARVLEAARATPGVAGAIGWCAFDYNTHKDFGSGDRICYHGVMDMFRIAKYASYAYSSQRDRASGVVLEAATVFAKGERSSAKLLPIVVYTNCDEIVLYRSGTRVGSYYPAKADFPHLAHPPVLIADLIGDQLEETSFAKADRKLIKSLAAKALAGGLESLSWAEKARFGIMLLKYRMTMKDAEALVGKYALAWGLEDDGFELAGLADGREIARRRYGGDACAAGLSMAADDGVLSAGDWDTTRVELRLNDQYGNLYPFASETVDISITGPADVIGPTRVPLIGGCIAFWIRTRGEPGDVRLGARGTRFEALPVVVRVE
ncbi:MAG: glycoside hydrolase family 2 protein [Spirochaetes bacterium]|nr:glycoside hydrolase family 2 protein [Spirochaetota bacterium]MBU1079093.1 glycoside hydrolase family 2 protein [Spirochaetota bacterium]